MRMVTAGRSRMVSARRTMLAAGVVFAALALGVVPSASRSAAFAPFAQAQNMGMRTVNGTVLNSAGQPIADATVFLQSQKTKTIRSFTSIANGHFSFAQVDKSQDFNLWAEKNGKKSAVKTVSSWDTRDTYFTDLTLK